MLRSTSRGWLATCFVLLLPTALAAAPAGLPHAQSFRGGEPFPVQTAPEEAPPPEVMPEGVPEEALPPPILPAPDLPGGDPVVELPPEGEAQAPAVAAPILPGQPAPGGGIFSFADLAEQLVDSVVYISTAQRITISRRTPPP